MNKIVSAAVVATGVPIASPLTAAAAPTYLNSGSRCHMLPSGCRVAMELPCVISALPTIAALPAMKPSVERCWIGQP
jgi:hypothetical protein